MKILINLNTYLGGGETLLVRMAEYFENTQIPYRVICSSNSYIKMDLESKTLLDRVYAIENSRADYYYFTEHNRKLLINEIVKMIPSEDDEVSLITFCMRDLYTFSQVAKQNHKFKVVHLVLHYQDNLYVCQSLRDKAIKMIFGKEYYSLSSQINFNKQLFNHLCDSGAIIPMSDLMVDFWNKKFGIKLNHANVVPLPTYDFPILKHINSINNHRILFIGRIVDFKIPGLCVMLNYINRHKEYSLTVVGDGDMKTIKNYIKKKKIDDSRISFLGQISYNNLVSIIKQHSIGYAMGTSGIEICKYGLPVIMALSNPKHQLFKKEICGGLYANCVRGNVGDNLFAGENEEEQPLLENVMNDLERNYYNSAVNCYEYVKKEYGLTKNMQSYISIIDKASITDFTDFEITKPSYLRKFLKRKLKK